MMIKIVMKTMLLMAIKMIEWFAIKIYHYSYFFSLLLSLLLLLLLLLLLFFVDILLLLYLLVNLGRTY